VRTGLGEAEGSGVAMAIARDGGATDSETPRASSIGAAGVFRGFGVSSSGSDLDFALFLVLLDGAFDPAFFFAVFGLGVGVWPRFGFGVGVFFGFGVPVLRGSDSSD
jgi:hypothetical protein